MITVYANYEGDPNFLLGTAPLFIVEPLGDQTGAARVHRPDPEHPDQHPGRRCAPASDYGLRFTVSNITQLTPLAGAEPDVLGLPGCSQPRHRTLPQRLAGSSVQLPRALPTRAASASRRRRASRCTRSPTTRRPAPESRWSPTLEVQTYQDPAHLVTETVGIPGNRPAATSRFSTPVLYASPTTNETDAPPASTST